VAGAGLLLVLSVLWWAFAGVQARSCWAGGSGPFLLGGWRAFQRCQREKGPGRLPVAAGARCNERNAQKGRAGAGGCRRVLAALWALLGRVAGAGPLGLSLVLWRALACLGASGASWAPRTAGGWFHSFTAKRGRLRWLVVSTGHQVAAPRCRTSAGWCHWLGWALGMRKRDGVGRWAPVPVITPR